MYVFPQITVNFVDADTKEPVDGIATVSNTLGFSAEVASGGSVDVKPTDYLITPTSVADGYVLPEAQDKYVFDYEKQNTVTFEVVKKPVPVAPVEPVKPEEPTPPTTTPVDPTPVKDVGEVTVTTETKPDGVTYKTLPKTGGVTIPEEVVFTFVLLCVGGAILGIITLVVTIVEKVKESADRRKSLEHRLWSVDIHTNEILQRIYNLEDKQEVFFMRMRENEEEKDERIDTY